MCHWLEGATGYEVDDPFDVNSKVYITSMGTKVTIDDALGEFEAKNVGFPNILMDWEGKALPGITKLHAAAEPPEKKTKLMKGGFEPGGRHRVRSERFGRSEAVTCDRSSAQAPPCQGRSVGAKFEQFGFEPERIDFQPRN